MTNVSDQINIAIPIQQGHFVYTRNERQTHCDDKGDRSHGIHSTGKSKCVPPQEFSMNTWELFTRCRTGHLDVM